MSAVVYRLYGVDDQLLYIGVTSNIQQRFVAHAVRSHWWPEVRSRRLEQFEEWRDAFLAEGQAIRREAPLHNQIIGKWRGIADDLRDRIAAGTLRAGEPLPTARKLAEHYGCSLGPVRQAITMLLHGGELRGQQGLAVYVAGPSSG